MGSIKNVLITGGAGFVGSHLAEYYLKEGKGVTILDNLSRAGVDYNLEHLRRNHPQVRFVKADVRDFNAVKKAVKGSDLIHHCASQVAVTTSIAKPLEDFEVNALGTINLLEAMRQVADNAVLIFASTNKVYGENVNDIPLKELDTRYDFADPRYAKGIPEDFPIDAVGHSPYGVSKLAADQYVRDYYATYGLETITFRMSCVCGTRQFGTEDQGWLAHFVISATLGRPLTIYGDGKQVRDVLCVNDLIKAFDMASNNAPRTKGQAYNVGGGKANTISLLELIDQLEKLLGRKIRCSFDEWRPADQKVYYSDITKAKRDFGWEPEISKKEGIKRILGWVKENERLF